jgi:hypothetical protein
MQQSRLLLLLLLPQRQLLPAAKAQRQRLQCSLCQSESRGLQGESALPAACCCPLIFDQLPSNVRENSLHSLQYEEKVRRKGEIISNVVGGSVLRQALLCQAKGLC